MPVFNMKKLSPIPTFFWKILFIVIVLFAWEIVARLQIFSSFVFPSITGTIIYMTTHPSRLLDASWGTFKLLLIGLAIGSLLSLTASAIASLSKKLRIVLETYVTIANPIPSTSILPFALLWFGLGERPIIFVTMFSSLCPFIIAALSGFQTIKGIYWDVGKMYGLSKANLTRHILLPASFPHILTGFRTAWGSSWRTVVAAELVFGAVGQGGGLGWLIYVNRFQLNPAGMLACLICICIIGIIAEQVLELTERKTIKKWGMKV